MGGETYTHMDLNGHPTDEQLFDLSAGTLRRAERAAVEQHVLTCDRCAAEVEQARAFGSFPGEVERLPVAASSQLQEAITREWELREVGQREAAQLPGWRRMLNVALAAALVAAVMGVLVTNVGPGIGDADVTGVGASAPRPGASDGDMAASGSASEPTEALRGDAGAVAPQAMESASDDHTGAGARWSREEQQPHSSKQQRHSGSEADAAGPEPVTVTSAPAFEAMPRCVLVLPGEKTGMHAPTGATTSRLAAGPISSVMWQCLH